MPFVVFIISLVFIFYDCLAGCVGSSICSFYHSFGLDMQLKDSKINNRKLEEGENVEFCEVHEFR